VKKEKRLFMIGNSHIDPVWLWQWQEGFQEIKATFRSVLDRMNEYDDFIFTGSSAAFYEWVEQNDPAMFEEIKRRVEEGRWVIAGGWWIQPDCNAPSGESFVRQGLYGQNYFKEKLGRRAVCGYNVDSFGHNGNLPQILKKCGMDDYVFMRPGRHEKGIPEETFLWESRDGSQVTAFRIPFEYCTWPEEIEEHIKRCAGEIKKPEDAVMCFYGVGNHGGGPTKRNIDSIHALNQKKELPELIMASPEDYFEDVRKSQRKLPVVCEDLFHHASGCYSAHSEVKRLNRSAETRLVLAERLSVMAKLLTGHDYSMEEYRKAWKSVLFNQFHDILSGSSIEDAYEDAKEDYGYALHIAAREMNAAVQAMTWRINIPMEEDMRPLAVVNPCAFSVKTEIEMEILELKENTVLLDEEDNQVPFQLIQSHASCNGRCRIVFVAELPAMGWRTYRFAIREKVKKFTDVVSTENSAENRWFRIVFDKETGYITSFLMKNDNTEYFEKPAAVPVVIRDNSDTWSHGVRIFGDEKGRFKGVSVKRIENGPVRCVIRVISTYENSRILQDFSIYKELDYVSVSVTVDWHEKQSMLKLEFPMNMNYLRTSWEIPYSVSQREPGGEEYPMQTWVDLEGAAPGLDTMMNGLTLLNDSKFAGSVSGKTAAVTVLRSPVYAHHEPHELQEGQEYTYLDQGVQSFQYGLYPHSGSWEDADTVKRAKAFCQRPVALFETYHQGNLPQTGSFLEVSAENICLEVLKEAEDGSGSLVLRLYETAGKKTTAQIKIPSVKWCEEWDFTPFEIKTIRLSKDGKAVETNMLEEE